MFGNPETTTGGNALKFYASVRLDVRRHGQIKSGDEATGNETTVKVVKNKVAPPFRKAEFVIEYGKGICRGTEVLDMAVNFDIIHKAGSWFSYNGEKLGQGRDAVAKVLDENPDLYEEIEQLVRQKVSGISGDVDDITVHADEFEI